MDPAGLTWLDEHEHTDGHAAAAGLATAAVLATASGEDGSEAFAVPGTVHVTFASHDHFSFSFSKDILLGRISINCSSHFNFQLQTAVVEMEKALDMPSTVMIYKQQWDCYFKAPALLEKLKLEQPFMHHLLHHFRQNFWHLVEQEMIAEDTIRREGSVSATSSNVSATSSTESATPSTISASLDI